MTAGHEAALPVAEMSVVARQVRALSRGYRGALVCVLLTGLAGAAAGLLIPVAVGRLVDALRDDSATTQTWVQLSAVMLLAALAVAGLNAVSVRLAGVTYQGILARLRELMVRRAMRLPQHRVEQAGTGDLISRSSDDVAQIGDAAPRLVPAFTTAAFTTAATVIGVPSVDVRYAAALVGMGLVYVVAVRWYVRVAPAVYRAERTAMSGRAQQIAESARGHRTIAGLGIAAHRHDRVLEASWQVARPTLRAATMQNMFLGRLLLAQYVGLGIVLAVGFLMVRSGRSTVGEATAATLILQRMFLPMTQLLLVVDISQSVLTSLSRIVGVIAVPDAAEETEHTIDGSVHVSGLHFAYPDGTPALETIDLAIRPGEHVAVVGVSGAGKTTLASVIAGTHTASVGSVACPERTVVVTQETHVFTGTIRDNLTLSAPDATDERVHDALVAVGAPELGELSSKGLDTVVGTTGLALTPAQAQQIALARVLLADPELVILDEATAEAGSADAGVLDRAAQAALNGRTGLVIAHRLSQAAVCDRVVVMDHGRIVQQGTHTDLLARGGTYGSLWTAWTRSEDLVRPGPGPASTGDGQQSYSARRHRWALRGSNPEPTD